MTNRRGLGIAPALAAAAMLFCATAPAAQFPVTTEAGKWNLVGCGCATGTAPAAFTGLADPIMFGYAAASYAAGLAELESGRGYWVWIPEDSGMDSVTCDSTVSAPSVDINIEPGWNLIANPYSTAVNWSEVAGGAAMTAGPLGYNPDSGEYDVDAVTLAPWTGYWVKADSTSTLTVTNPSQAEPPTAVTLSDPTGATAATVDLAWTRNLDPDFDSYRVYRAHAPGVDQSSTLAATVTARDVTSSAITGLAAATTYYFRVFVCSAGGLCAGSNEVSGTTAEQGQVGPPTDVETTECGPTRVCMSFTPEPGTATNVYVGDSDKPVNDCPVTGSSYAVGGLDSGQEFNFKLKSVDQLGQESALAAEQQGNTVALEPGSGGAVGGRTKVNGACDGPGRVYGRTARAHASAAAVTVVSQTLGEQPVTVDEFGNFEAVDMPPGAYDVKIELANPAAGSRNQLSGGSEVKNLQVADAQAAGLGDMQINGFADILVNAANDKIYITDYYYGVVFVIDGSDYTASIYETADLPWALAQDETLDIVYISTLLPFGEYHIHQMDPATDTYTRSVSIDIEAEPNDSLPWGMDLNENTGYIYIADMGLNRISVLDTSEDGTLLGSYIDVGLMPAKPHVDYALEQVYVEFLSGALAGYDILTIDETTGIYYPVTIPGGPYAFAEFEVNKAEHSAYHIGVSQWLDEFQFTKLTQEAPIPLAMPFEGLVPWSLGIDRSRNLVYISCFTEDASGIIALDGESLVYTGAIIETMNDFSAEPPSAIRVNELSNKIYAVQNWDAYTVVVVDGNSNETLGAVNLYAYLREYYDTHY